MGRRRASVEPLSRRATVSAASREGGAPRPPTPRPRRLRPRACDAVRATNAATRFVRGSHAVDLVGDLVRSLQTADSDPFTHVSSADTALGDRPIACVARDCPRTDPRAQTGPAPTARPPRCCLAQRDRAGTVSGASSSTSEPLRLARRAIEAARPDIVLRPDDRADRRLPNDAPATQPTTGEGFDWVDAGIGSAATLGLVLLLAGASVLRLRHGAQTA